MVYSVNRCSKCLNADELKVHLEPVFDACYSSDAISLMIEKEMLLSGFHRNPCNVTPESLMFHRENVLCLA